MTAARLSHLLPTPAAAIRRPPCRPRGTDTPHSSNSGPRKPDRADLEAARTEHAARAAANSHRSGAGAGHQEQVHARQIVVATGKANDLLTQLQAGQTSPSSRSSSPRRATRQGRRYGLVQPSTRPRRLKRHLASRRRVERVIRRKRLPIVQVVERDPPASPPDQLEPTLQSVQRLAKRQRSSPRKCHWAV